MNLSIEGPLPHIFSCAIHIEILLGLQGDIVAERSQKAALERMLQEEKDLMDSALRREIGKAADLQVELTAARQQKASLLHIWIMLCLLMPWLASSRSFSSTLYTMNTSMQASRVRITMYGL